MTLLERMARAWWEASAPVTPWEATTDGLKATARARCIRLQGGHAPTNASDRAALAVLREHRTAHLPVMARVYLVALGTPHLAIDEATLEHMGALYDGAEPVTAADVSALSVPREELAPPPPCAMCGDDRRVKINPYREGTMDCPDCARGAR